LSVNWNQINYKSYSIYRTFFPYHFVQVEGKLEIPSFAYVLKALQLANILPKKGRESVKTKKEVTNKYYK